MSTTMTPHRHLELVESRPSDHDRDRVIAAVAARAGWSGTVDEQARQRRALRHACPRSSCRAEIARACRRWVRGRWRPTTGPHNERCALVDDETDTDHA